MKTDLPHRLRQLVVDRVEAEDGQHDVLFLGTGERQEWRAGRDPSARTTGGHAAGVRDGRVLTPPSSSSSSSPQMPARC